MNSDDEFRRLEKKTVYSKFESVGDARVHECSSVNVGLEPGCLASR